MKKFFNAQILILVLSLGVIPAAHAVEVTDPDNYLSQLQYMVNPVPFKQAFTCGQEFAYTATDSNCNVKCTNSMCQSECYGSPNGVLKPKLFVENCTDTSVSVYGDNGWSVEVTKEDYERGGSTMAISALKNIGHYVQPGGDLTITGVWPMFSYDLIRNGTKVRISTVSVEAEINTNTSQKPRVSVVLNRDSSGVEQMVILNMDLQTEFLRLKGLFDVH